MKPARFTALISLCASFLLAGCLGGLLPFSEKTDYRLLLSSADPDLQDYLKGILDDRLAQKLESTGDPETDARRETHREQMIRADLLKALHARGHYDGKVDYADDEQPLGGTYDIMPGPLYTIAASRINAPGMADLPAYPDIQPGQPLDAGKILAVQDALHRHIQRDGCHFSLNVSNAVILNQRTHTADLTINVAAGTKGHFGPVTFTGQDTVKASYLQKLVPWREGECFRHDRIEQLRAQLLGSGLFSRADAILPAAPLPDGSVPIEIQLGERAHRTVSAGLSYYTDEGPGATLGWVHRNFFGGAEKLEIALSISALKQSLDAELTKPFFIRKDQTLSISGAIRRQDTDAYEEMGIDLGMRIKRDFTRRLSGSTGIAFTLTQIDEKNNIRNEKDVYGLISLPNSLAFDSRDDKLDPRKGWFLTAALTPFFDVLGTSDPFVKAQMGASTYLAFGESQNTVLALRANLGSIMGSGAFNIPPTERFYAGGGGSVRGFGYQEVGPKDSGGDPVGGRSIVTASSELRVKFTDKIGGVAFVDAGSVTSESYPDMDNMAVGAGVGFRYYTDFGPLRVDIATPVTKRDESDQAVHFYISIGQAF